MPIRHQLRRFLATLERNYTTHNQIEVSRSALLANLDVFTQLAGQPAIAVLKANAYGHGIGLVAQALKTRKLPYIAVDGYFEALRVREVSRQPVLIMGAISAENYQRIRYDQFAFVVQDEASIRALGHTGKAVKVHLEVNTGMNRYGAQPGEVTTLTRLILDYPNLTLEGVMSHLADSDGDDPETVREAVALFDSCVEAVREAGAAPTLIHIAQGAGSLIAKSQYANTFRLGLGLYGVNPFPPHHALYKRLIKLRPALKLTSTITKTIALQQGDKVSYNYTFTAPKAMTIGVLPLGYYEGVPRALSNAGVVKVGEVFTPIIGRVCMNHTMIRLDGDINVGDKVVVYSNDPSDKNTIDRIAHDHQLFTYSLLTGLSQDIRRVLVD